MNRKRNGREESNGKMPQPSTLHSSTSSASLPSSVSQQNKNQLWQMSWMLSCLWTKCCGEVQVGNILCPITGTQRLWTTLANKSLLPGLSDFALLLYWIAISLQPIAGTDHQWAPQKEHMCIIFIVRSTMKELPSCVTNDKMVKARIFECFRN